MTKLILIALAGLFVILPSAARAGVGDHLWSKTLGGGSVAKVDGSGQMVIAGNFNAPIDMGGGILTPLNAIAGDVFLARFDAAGNFLWDGQFTPGGQGCSIDDLAVAPDGSIYLFGTLWSGDVDFGGGTLTGDNEVVVAAFAPDGTHRWSFVLGSANIRSVDASNHTVALTGYTYGTLDFGGGPLTVAGGADAFVGQLRVDGSVRMGALFGGTANQGGMGIAVQPTEGISLAMTSDEDIDLGGGPLSAEFADLCIASFDSTGAHEWGFSIAGDFSPGGGILATLDLDVAADGRTAVAGEFNYTVNFGGAVLATAGGTDAFVAIYDAAGAHLSSQSWGGNKSDTPQGVSFDSAGNLAISGVFYSAAVDFGGDTFNHLAPFSGDWFVAMYDATGAHLYSESFVEYYHLQMWPSFNGADDLVLVASGSGVPDFGGGPLPQGTFFVTVREGAGGGGTTAAPAIARRAALGQNFPNPFNPSTQIPVVLESAAKTVVLRIHDTRGRLIATLQEGSLPAGTSMIRWDGRDATGSSVPSGTYYYRLEAGDTVVSRKMSLVK